MNGLLQKEHELHTAAAAVLANSRLIPILTRLGEPVISGSFQTGLMVHPDLDFILHSASTTYNDIVEVVPTVQAELKPNAIKIADFAKDPNEAAIGYIGVDFVYGQLVWHVSAVLARPGPIITNPPELKAWLKSMTEDERITILKLKKQLIDSQRYGSSHSKPPYTFRSVHLYEAVLVGKAATIKDLEKYFT